MLREEKRKRMQALRDDPTQHIGAICKTRGVSRTTFYRYTEEKKRETGDLTPLVHSVLYKP